MILSKKAQLNLLKTLFITLAVAVVVFAIGIQVRNKLSGAGDDESCRISILAKHGAGKIQTGPMSAPDVISLECPRNVLRVEMEDVEKYSRIDDDMMKTVLAEEMKACWGKVGGGKLDPFRSTSTVDSKFCMVCTEIYFDADVQEQARSQNYNLNGFEYWISTHKLPGIKTSLYEYITGVRPPVEMLRMMQSNRDASNSRVDLSEKYVVAWRVNKYEIGFWGYVARYGIYVLSGAALGIPGAVAAAVGIGVEYGVSGGDRMVQQVFLIPESRLTETQQFSDDDRQEFCTVMVN